MAGPLKNSFFAATLSWPKIWAKYIFSLVRFSTKMFWINISMDHLISDQKILLFSKLRLVSTQLHFVLWYLYNMFFFPIYSKFNILPFEWNITERQSCRIDSFLLFSIHRISKGSYNNTPQPHIMSGNAYVYNECTPWYLPCIILYSRT